MVFVGNREQPINSLKGIPCSRNYPCPLRCTPFLLAHFTVCPPMRHDLLGVPESHWADSSPQAWAVNAIPLGPRNASAASVGLQPKWRVGIPYRYSSTWCLKMCQPMQGPLMHVKCIHDICSLLDRIPSYLIVLWGPGHVFHWFRQFSKQPPFILFEHYKADFLVFACFWLSRTFWTSNGPKLFATSFFREIEDREKNSMGNTILIPT
jgi:hypothetical protein